MPDSISILLIEANSKRDYAAAKELFVEYASQIGIDLGFQNFNKELETMKEMYRPPHGTIYLAFDPAHQAVGCFAIRRFEDHICELKRMYLRKEFQGYGIGSMMLKKSIAAAKNLGYNKMRLDTLPTMRSAIALYTKTGFYEIPAYRFNPIEGSKYFEIELEKINFQ